MKKKFLSMLLAITATISLSVNSFAADTQSDYFFFDVSHNQNGEESRWNFIKIIYEDLGFGLLKITQHIGIWGTILGTMVLIAGLIIWQGNMKERTKVIKSIGVLIVAFALLISIISWVSLFQRVTTLPATFTY